MCGVRRLLPNLHIHTLPSDTRHPSLTLKRVAYIFLLSLPHKKGSKWKLYRSKWKTRISSLYLKSFLPPVHFFPLYVYYTIWLTLLPLSPPLSSPLPHTTAHLGTTASLINSPCHCVFYVLFIPQYISVGVHA